MLQTIYKASEILAFHNQDHTERAVRSELVDFITSVRVSGKTINPELTLFKFRTCSTRSRNVHRIVEGEYE